MKPYAKILQSVDTDFQNALEKLRIDPLFERTDGLYSTDDKKRIATIWREIIRPFRVLKWLIRSMYWRSFFGFGSKNSFAVNYASVITYYNMVYELQRSFGPHEEFLRQYLDDTFRENYSTLARYMYHIRFYSILIFPREYFLTLRDDVHASLIDIFERPEKAAGDSEMRFSHDMINIWYYIRYRISLLIAWISKRFGLFIAPLHFSRRDNGLIQSEHVDILLRSMLPGDILLTRRNWAVTNISIPGFWKHMSMYIGTGEYLRRQFGHISFPEAIQDTQHYIIEAVGTGVHISPIAALSSHNDYLGVVRARFSLSKIERAIHKTLTQVHRPYDFSFNYYSDLNHVCSALITKAYLPEYDTDEGLHITLTRIAMGMTYPPHDLLKKIYQEQQSMHRELDFVGFIDLKEREALSFISTESEFLSTVNRSRLSLLLP